MVAFPSASLTVPIHYSKFGHSSTPLRLKIIVVENPHLTVHPQFVRYLQRTCVKALARVDFTRDDAEDRVQHVVPVLDINTQGSGVPSSGNIDRWCGLLDSVTDDVSSDADLGTIAIQNCGTSRAAFLVALTLLEYSGLKPDAAISSVQENFPAHPLSDKETMFLRDYTPRWRRGGCCIA